MPATRKVKFLRKPASLSMNLPLLEAFGIFLHETTKRVYSAQYQHSVRLAEYFTSTVGPSVRLRQCRVKNHLAAYTQFRRRAGAVPAVIEHEIETLRALLYAAQTGEYQTSKERV